MQNVVILGAGRIGPAIAKLIGKNAETEIWDKNPELVPGQKALDAIVPKADIIFYCVPSFAIRSASSEIVPMMKKGALVVSLSKGIERETTKTMADVLEEALPGRDFALLSGPMLSEELEKDLGGAAVVGASKRESFDRIAELFRDSTLRLQHSSDVKGVAFAGVLKNVYAIALGMAEGLGWGDNMKGWIVGQAVEEMQNVIEELGGNPTTALSQAGLGDLVATGFSPYSSNHRYGKAMAENRKAEHESEGAISLPSLHQMLEQNGKRLRLFSALSKIVIDKVNTRNVFEELLTNGAS